MPPDTPRYEYRAWAPAFPGLPQPEGEAWSEETYLVALGLLSLNIKIRDDALEIKQLKLDNGRACSSGRRPRGWRSRSRRSRWSAS